MVPATSEWKRTNSGNNADYATLKAAFDAINAGTHTGVINIGVCGDTTETASAVLNASGVGECELHFGSDHANRSENGLRRDCGRQSVD